MANQGILSLKLIDVSHKPAQVQGVRVGVFRGSDNEEILRFDNLHSPPDNALSVPAFPEEKIMYCVITTDRYRQGRSGFFFVKQTNAATQEIPLFRRPDRWDAKFEPWDLLPVSMAPFKKVLSESPNLHLKGGANLGTFVKANYNQAPDQKLMLAKATLLNLFFKLTDLKEPVTGNKRSWFSFIKEILQIGRERLIAVVEDGLEDIIRKIANTGGELKKSPSGDHHKNFLNLGFDVPKAGMISIKSDEKQANIQLTLAKGKAKDGTQVLLLDTDIDENGELFPHLVDALIVHKFSGGTHPYDIHEWLVFQSAAKLGYTLI